MMRVPVICCETKLAVTPMQNDIRFAGTMEINGFDAKNNVKRIQGIKNSINNYFPNIQIPQIPSSNQTMGKHKNWDQIDSKLNVATKIKIDIQNEVRKAVHPVLV